MADLYSVVSVCPSQLVEIHNGMNQKRMKTVLRTSKRRVQAKLCTLVMYVTVSSRKSAIWSNITDRIQVACWPISRNYCVWSVLNRKCCVARDFIAYLRFFPFWEYFSDSWNTFLNLWCDMLGAPFVQYWMFDLYHMWYVWKCFNRT